MPNEPASSTCCTSRVLEAELLEQQRPAGRDRGLGELQLAHVALGEVRRTPSGSARRHVGPVQHEDPLLADARCSRSAQRAAAISRGRLVGDEPARTRRAGRPGPARRPRRPGRSRTGPRGSTSPITCSSTSVVGSSLTTSMAPSAARMPQRIAPPSNAGPAGAAVDTIVSPSLSTISQLVPTSMNSRVRLSRSMPVASMPGDDVAADVGAERREHDARGPAGAACRPRSAASTSGGVRGGHHERRDARAARGRCRAPARSSSRCRRARPRRPRRVDAAPPAHTSPAQLGERRRAPGRAAGRARRGPSSWR